ncbi:PPE family protein [Mycobacterium tuberculosis]|nr:PPE family protein [Mycobacterium tuberculosis]CNV15068.1 PPE family protein [Mycobacterium tuberculosis]CNV66766.1 PPE family protein [Mycobacterium tuberculosis]CPB74117.1 PPE family protein [Mycobacterium tuberculosis]
MQDIDAAAEAAAQPSHALGWLPIEEIDAAASDDGEVSSSPQLPPRPFMMPHTPSGG